MTYSWDAYNTTTSDLMEDDFCDVSLVEEGTYNEELFGNEVTSDLKSYYFEQLGEVENTLSCCLDDLEDSPEDVQLQEGVKQARAMFSKAQKEWDLVLKGQLPWLVS